MRLVDCFLKIMVPALLLQEGTAQAGPSYEEVSADLEKFWPECETLAKKAGFSSEDYDQARFAVCAWVDETIMLSNWEGRDQWAAQTLQRRFYNTANAGNEFFDRLAQIPENNLAVKEVYAACLALGFKGRYFHESQSGDLETVKKETLQLLGRPLFDPQRGPDEPFFPAAYPLNETAYRQNRWYSRISPLTVTLALLPPALLVSLFAIYRLILNKNIYDFFRATL